MNDLPDEITLNIMLRLNTRDLLRCRQVCTRWNRVGQDNTLWIPVLKEWVKHKRISCSARGDFGVYFVDVPLMDYEPKTLNNPTHDGYCVHLRWIPSLKKAWDEYLKISRYVTEIKQRGAVTQCYVLREKP